MGDTTSKTDKRLTIRLTDARPISILMAEWPIEGRASYSDWDGEHECQATRTSRVGLYVRRHRDGRRIVYGWVETTSQWRGERDIDHGAGERLAVAATDADVVAAIHRVASSLAEAGEDLRDLPAECIASLPAEEVS